MYLLDSIGNQLLQFRNDDGRDGFDQFFHFVETLLLVIHVHLFQFGDQIAQDVVLFVLEAADHELPVYGFLENLFALSGVEFSHILWSLFLVVEEADQVVLLAEVEGVDGLFEIFFDFLVEWLHVVQSPLLLEFLV